MTDQQPEEKLGPLFLLLLLITVFVLLGAVQEVVSCSGHTS
jgi:hypothetical protein